MNRLGAFTDKELKSARESIACFYGNDDLCGDDPEEWEDETLMSLVQEITAELERREDLRKYWEGKIKKEEVVEASDNRITRKDYYEGDPSISSLRIDIGFLEYRIRAEIESLRTELRGDLKEGLAKCVKEYGVD